MNLSKHSAVNSNKKTSASKNINQTQQNQVNTKQLFRQSLLDQASGDYLQSDQIKLEKSNSGNVKRGQFRAGDKIISFSDSVDIIQNNGGFISKIRDQILPYGILHNNKGNLGRTIHKLNTASVGQVNFQKKRQFTNNGDKKNDQVQVEDCLQKGNKQNHYHSSSSYYHETYMNMLKKQSGKTLQIQSNFQNQIGRKQKTTIQIPVSSDQISTSSTNEHDTFVKQLQAIIFVEIKSMELKELKGNYILEHITDDLEIQMEGLQKKAAHEKISVDELLRLRMHIQAISKIMVFIHGKSEFRLVTAHYYLGQAYRLNGCYEQAIDHFTISLKKNAKLTEIKETKIYHSFILTSLSQCYFELEMYADTLEILLRAYQIQQCYVNSELKINNIKTIKLISESYLKVKNFRQAIEYMEKICQIVDKLKGSGSKEYAEIKFEKAVIIGEQCNHLGAIEEVKAAIGLVHEIKNLDQRKKQNLTLVYKKKLAEFLQRFGDFESQIECLRQMLKIIISRNLNDRTPINNAEINNSIAIRKKIVVIAVKHSDYEMAIRELQEVLMLEEERYGCNSVCLGKTMKMLGLVHLHLGNQRHAEEYLKKCYKLSQELKQPNKAYKKQVQVLYSTLGYDKRPSHMQKRKISCQNNPQS